MKAEGRRRKAQSTFTLYPSSFILVGLLLLPVACVTGNPCWAPRTVEIPLPSHEGVEPAPPLESHAEFPDISNIPEGDADQEIGVPRKLTRDGALLAALANNRAIEVARFGPTIAETFIPEARAAFDPVLLGAVSTGYDKRPLVKHDDANEAPASPSAILNPQSPIPGILTATQQLINDLDQLTALGAQPGVPFTRTEDTTGSVSLQTLTPLGTRISLSTDASATESATLGGSTYKSGWSLDIVQPLLAGAGSVNLITLKQAGNRLAKGKEAFRAAVLNTVEQVESAYWDLALAYEVLQIRAFAVKLADEQLKRNEDLLAVGKAIEGDVAAARAEKASRSADLTDAQAAIRTQTLAIIRLLNPDNAQPWRLTFEPVDAPETVQTLVNADSSEKLALEYRPELAEARLDVANSSLEVDRARNGRLPHLDLVASYGKTSLASVKSGLTKYLDDDDFASYRIGAQFETPILYREEKARFTRAKLTARQAALSVTDLEQAIATQVRQAVVEVERQWERIGAAEEAIKSRAEQLRVTEGRNAVGKTTNLDLFLVQRDFVQAQVDQITARVKYVQALTGLYAAEGTLLDRRGISLDAEPENS